MNMKAMQDLDNLKAARAAYYAGTGTEEAMREAAVKVIENKQAAEKKLKGRVITKVNAASIAHVLRAV